jgi:pyruvate-ferredoxin/flavodoxin oxidoreductase
LLEFHGACPGCGETPYISLATQLYGEHMMIANATGCSSIYGASMPSTPYTTNAEGHGPAWANSLFEDNAEFGMGMHVANETIRNRVANIMRNSMDEVPNAIVALYKDFLEYKDDRVKTAEIRDRLVPLLEENLDIPSIAELYTLKRYIAKKSQWIIGGDGWAYDIGYGGLDHVSASGEDVNILVVDTEVYSNTGGQSSKASHAGSVALFTTAGKPVCKKDLGQISMTYGNIYVASINSNASQAHTLKVMRDAEDFPGVSIIIAYSPCIAHGIKGGLGASGDQAKLATTCGYWPTYTYDPRLMKEGKNPMKIACKEPDWDLYEEFLSHEVRYNALRKTNPEHAAELYEKNKTDAQFRWRQLKRLAEGDYSNEVE